MENWLQGLFHSSQTWSKQQLCKAASWLTDHACSAILVHRETQFFYSLANWKKKHVHCSNWRQLGRQWLLKIGQFAISVINWMLHIRKLQINFQETKKHSKNSVRLMRTWLIPVQIENWWSKHFICTMAVECINKTPPWKMNITNFGLISGWILDIWCTFLFKITLRFWKVLSWIELWRPWKRRFSCQ